MLFSSLEFLIFLPVTALMFFGLGRARLFKAADIWLALASLFFYGWWNPKYLLLIVPLIAVNFFLAKLLLNNKNKALLSLGVVFNLSVLGYFKYANFFVENVNAVASTNYHLEKIILPLGISFFTFQKIAYLVDMYRGEIKEHSFIRYSLFVLFFPQLIAGPIVHHKEIIPQFSDKKFYKFDFENLSVGITIFVLGLFKKLVIADNAALFATPIFDAAASGVHLSTYQAWVAALTYTIQLYFDFSGYSDMAIGAARIFGVKLPVNFNSPYKSASIIEFWRRWHISLSRFLRDYVYIPLGGNRKGEFRRYINLFLTMLLAGFWHGAGWAFIVWGAFHASLICLNHLWRGLNLFSINKYLGGLITFVLVMIGWVVFRAENLSTAQHIISSMFSFNGGMNFNLKEVGQVVLPAVAIIFLMPNSLDLMEKYNPALGKEKNNLLVKICWKPTFIWALGLAILTAASVISMMLMQKSEFLYFDF